MNNYSQRKYIKLLNMKKRASATATKDPQIKTTVRNSASTCQIRKDSEVAMWNAGKKPLTSRPHKNKLTPS